MNIYIDFARFSVVIMTGFLGFGQEAGAEEALPLRQLAHLLHQVSNAKGIAGENASRVCTVYICIYI